MLRGEPGAIRLALRRRGTYSAAAREMLWGGVQLALYPTGLLARPSGPARPAAGPLLSIDPESAARPVVLVHGWFHNRNAFALMARGLRRHGYLNVESFTYGVVGRGVEECAGELRAHVGRVLDATGAGEVSLVGHSLGGLVARAFVQELGGDEVVRTCVTIATPHGGTLAARAAIGRAARQLRPGSSLLRRLDATARPVRTRFVAYYSNLDAVVLPARSAKLLVPVLRAENVLVRDCAHMSILARGDVIASVARTLAPQPDPEDAEDALDEDAGDEAA